MAKVFLDANYLIDALHRKPEKHILESLIEDMVFTSILSWHVYCYVAKIKIPEKRVIAQRDKVSVIEFTEDILDKALNGPTSDFEDNVQLHSAAQADCDVLLTQDKKLLAMKFFGKVRIEEELQLL